MVKTSIVGVTGSPSSPSRSRALVQAVIEEIQQYVTAEASHIDLSDIGPEVGRVWRRSDLDERTDQMLRVIETATLLVVGTPTYRGSYTGLFKHLFDLVNQTAFVGTPVVLTATGASDRHALVLEHQLRPLFGFFGAATVPTAIYASEQDFDGYHLAAPAIRQRIGLAAQQATQLLEAQVALVPVQRRSSRVA